LALWFGCWWTEAEFCTKTRLGGDVRTGLSSVQAFGKDDVPGGSVLGSQGNEGRMERFAAVERFGG
jgi:hypothetical protein